MKKREYSKPRLTSRGKRSASQPNLVDLHIGQRLRLRRNVLGWTQEQVGEMLGLTFQQVQKYEKGINRISGSRLYDFACILGVSVDFFYQDMPKEIITQSPRFIANKNSEIIPNELSTTLDPMKHSKIISLVKFYLKLPNPAVADSLYTLIKALSHVSGNNPLSSEDE